jgi:uncharacterized protein (DUF305 family)
VITLTARGAAAALVLSPLVLGCVTPKPAAPPSGRTIAVAVDSQRMVAPEPMTDNAAMAGHQHMPGMAMPVTIPKGALYTAADVHFMQGMIAHHGQAIHMSRLAAARGANPRVLKFANKIDQSQAAEIRLMQDWLRANGQAAPEADSWRTMSMPGMLTAEQLAQLETAKDAEFDRQFLTLMIQHHRGALQMVADLMATPLAAQDVDVNVFANDVELVQTTEIGIMLQMLADL